MKILLLELEIFTNIQLGVICTDMVDFCRLGHITVILEQGFPLSIAIMPSHIDIIIGEETGMLPHIGIRNKYCICYNTKHNGN